MFTAKSFAAPGDILFEDDFNSNLNSWTIDNTGGGNASIGNETSQSGNKSLRMRWDTVTLTSDPIAANVPGADFTVWIRHGSDAFSEDPDAGEDLIVQYLNNSAAWVTLETFYGGGTAGEIFIRSYTLPADALHANLQIRLNRVNGSGVDWDYWHIDDTVVTETVANTDVSACEDFESGYNWTASGTTNATGVSGATFNSPGNSMFLRWNTVTSTSPVTDFSAATQLNVTAWIRRGDDSFSEDPDNGEDLVFEYLNNVGSWVALETFSGNGGSGEVFNRNYAMNINALHANFQVRFRYLRGNGVDWDYWHVDDVCYVTPAPPSVDHFALNHDTTAVNCEAELITIEAHKVDHTIDTGYNGTLNLSTSTGNGDWSVFSGSGVLTPAGADSGSASYVFDSADNGVVQLLLKDTHVETVNINVFDISSGATETSGSALPAEDLDLAFTETGFRFIDAADVPIIGTQIAGKGSATAPNPQSLYLQAIRTSDDGSTCNGVFADGTTVNIDLGSSCSNPVSCLVGQRVSVTNNGITTAIANPQNQDAGLNYSSVPLTFTTNSRAPLVLNYADAGEVQLNARYNIPLGTGVPSGNLIIGNSNAFVVRPFGFDMDFSGQRAADYLDDGLLNNSTGANDSYAVDASGSVFQIAGADFPLTLRALVWDSADDADFNGEPDACANLTDNATTQNFGNETMAIVPSDVTLGHTLVEPVAGVAGTLTTSANSVSFASGVGSKNISWNEVGIMDQDVTLTSYLGAGQDVLGNVCNVGRFYPNNFSLTNPVVINRSDIVACADPFTYMGENFVVNYDLQATSLNPPGTVTQNYIGLFAKLDPAQLADMNYGATEAGTNLTARLGVASVGVFAAGVAPVTATLSLTRNAVPDGVYNNFQVGIVPADSDGVTLLPAALDLSLDGGPNTHGLLGQTDIRYGRLNLQNNFGSELLTLTLPLSTEYYQTAAAEFVTNVDDSCTTRTPANVLLYNDLEVKAGRAVGNPVINVNGGSNTTLTGITPFVAGQATLTFTAPGVEGYVDVEVQTPSWLLSNIDGIDQGIQGPGLHCTPGLAVSDPAYTAGCVADGNSVDDIPLSRGNFGIFKGSDNIIYIRETY